MSGTGKKDSESRADGASGSRAEKLAALAGEVDPRMAAEHLERMDPEYGARYQDREIGAHLAALATLGKDRTCSLSCLDLGDNLWQVTVVAIDHRGLFSVIAGTLASHALSIESGDVWTWSGDGGGAGPGVTDGRKPGKGGMRYDFRLKRYVPRRRPAQAPDPVDRYLRSKKIVDVFTVKALAGPPAWEEIESRLDELIRLLLEDRDEEARKRVGRSVVEYLSRTEREFPDKLLPVEVTVDNSGSERYTVMDIEAEDTPAFLYLFTNSLAMQGVDIHSIRISTSGGEVSDRFFITDSQGNRISSESRIDELKFIVVLVKQFSHLLVRSPDPFMALTNFEKLVERIYSDRKAREGEGWRMLDLSEQPVMEALARLFGTSNFLWEDFLRLQYENLLPVIEDLDALESYKDKAEMWSESEVELLGAKTFDEAVERLNRFKDREMFRIDMRHILDKIQSFTEFSRELTDLVEVVIEQTYRIADRDLSHRYGNPLCEDGSPCRFAVFALGKAGGRELGYASDIELLFVHSAEGQTAGPEKVNMAVYHEKLVQTMIRAIRAKSRGIFELDLRFRPYGKQGPLSNTLNQMREYYSENGPAWDFERQSLVRLRQVAGDAELGGKVLELRDSFVYSGKPLDFKELYRLRKRQLEEFVKPGTWNAKFSEGGLVEIEYHIQHLQIIHGAGEPALRVPGVRRAIRALCERGHLATDEKESLLEAHDFYRRLINALRILRGNARDLVVPERGTEEFLFLARRMGYERGRESRLAEDLVRHRTTIVRLVDWGSKIGETEQESSEGE